MMEENPELINDADRHIQAKLYEEAQGYAKTRTESRELNGKRADSRKRVGEMGFRVDAYQVGIRIVKDLSERDRKDFLRDLNLIVKVLGSRQAELFPEEALKIAKKEEQRKAAAKATKAELDAKSDTNKRSDPKSGGAGKAPKKTAAQKAADRAEALSQAKAPAPDGETADELIARVAAQKAAEQAEGDAILSAGLPETTKSQSQLAAERLAEAGLTK